MLARLVLGTAIAWVAACGDGAASDPDAAGRDAAARDARSTLDGSGGPDGATGVDGAGGIDATAGTDASGAPDGATALRDRAPVFDGTSGYIEIPDDDAFSQPTYGALTVEAWLRPDSLSMPEREGSGYVHWIGKGESGEHEWVGRMYQTGNSEGRNNRISFYSFNLEGGLGAGSYFEDDLTAGEWIHYAGTFDDARTYIFRDGVQRDSDLLSGYDIVPMNGSAPVRIGTRDENSFFEGSIARVAIYGARLTEEQLAAHVAARGDGTYDAVVLAEPSLIAYWPLDETSGAVAHDVVGGRDGAYAGGVDVGGTTWP